MSRRDSSRVHIAVRQNDTLAEFENFKKKFLFANKQITKQNCSLSAKIEELNAHISTLYVENLRLRASEIALQSQLKRERIKCHKIMEDAEAATVNLLKHFGIIRQSYNVPTERPQSPTESSPPWERCQKPPPRSPTAMRFAALPTVPDIAEDPEPHESSSEGHIGQNEIGGDEGHYAAERRPNLMSSRRRKSISRLPVPSRVSSPPPPPAVPSSSEESTSSSRKRKLKRRASGLMSPAELPPPRPVSPVLGSPMQQDIELSAEEEAAALQDVESIAAQEEEEEKLRELEVKKPRKKSKRDESELEMIERRERRKAKDRDRDRDASSGARLKDVTNSPRRRRAAASTAAGSTDEVEYHGQQGLSKEGKDHGSGRPALAISTPVRLPPFEEDKDTDMVTGYLPTPLPSSAGTTPVSLHFALPSSFDDEGNANGNAGLGGRERRTRKSVNYAEPKLNTKMRKPDSVPPPGARPSLPSMASSNAPAIASRNDNHERRRSSSGSSPELDAEVGEPGSDAPPPSSSRSGFGSKSATARRSTASSLASAAVPSSAPAKRKRHVRSLSSDDFAGTEEHEEDEELDSDGGGEADSEYSDFRTTWANVNTSSRRKSNQVGVSATKASSLGLEDGFGRRHSMAV